MICYNSHTFVRLWAKKVFFGAKKVFFGSKKGAWRKFWSFLHMPKDCQLLPPCLALLWSMGAISLFPPFWRLWAQDSQSAGRLKVPCHPDQGSAREAHCPPQVQPMMGDDCALTFWPQWQKVWPISQGMGRQLRHQQLGWRGRIGGLLLCPQPANSLSKGEKMLSLLYTALNIVAYKATYIVIWLKHFGNVALWAWGIWNWVRGLDWIPKTTRVPK